MVKPRNRSLPVDTMVYIVRGFIEMIYSLILEVNIEILTLKKI
jgi:hypothetical protein